MLYSLTVYTSSSDAVRSSSPSRKSKDSATMSRRRTSSKSNRACALCRKEATYLCSGCHAEWYCGRQCQVSEIPSLVITLHHFLLFFYCVTLATAVEITEVTASTMTLLVQEYLRQYNQLYPRGMVPKLHYLIHLPQQMKL